MSETLPLAEVKAKFSEMVERVDRTHDHIVVTRNGRPTVVMMSVEELESWEETLDILSDPRAMADIREGLADLAAGNYVSGDEIRNKYL